MTFTNSYTLPNIKSQAISTSSTHADKQLTQSQSFISKFLRKIADGLTRSSDPHFYQEMSSSGEVVWIAYDPDSATTHKFDSEAMAMMWVEQRCHKK